MARSSCANAQHWVGQKWQQLETKMKNNDAKICVRDVKHNNIIRYVCTQTCMWSVYMNSMNKNVSSFSYNAPISVSLLPVGWTVFKYLFKLTRAWPLQEEPWHAHGIPPNKAVHRQHPMLIFSRSATDLPGTASLAVTPPVNPPTFPTAHGKQQQAKRQDMGSDKQPQMPPPYDSISPFPSE